MEEKIIEAAKELLIQIHEKEKMSDFEITIATETLRVLLHSVLNGLSERDKFAMEFAEWMSTEGLSHYAQLGLWYKEDSDKTITAQQLLDLYKQSLTKTDKK